MSKWEPVSFEHPPQYEVQQLTTKTETYYRSRWKPDGKATPAQCEWWSGVPSGSNLPRDASTQGGSLTDNPTQTPTSVEPPWNDDDIRTELDQ